MAIVAEAVTAPAGAGVLLEYSDVQAVLGQVRCSRDPTQASANYKNSFSVHFLPYCQSG